MALLALAFLILVGFTLILESFGIHVPKGYIYFAMFFSMAIANIIGLYIMAPEVKQDLDSYWTRLKTGEIRPYKERLAELETAS